jgi:DNA-binding CsgD family transcriptional regulator
MPRNPPRTTEGAFENTIGAIYDAAVAPERWMDALWQLYGLFGLGSAAFVIHNADRSETDGMAAGVDADEHRASLNTIFRTSVLYTRSERWVPGQITRSADQVPNKIFHRSRMYQEYWRPRELYDAIRLTISVDDAGIHHAVNLHRPNSGEMFDRSDIALAGVLIPHLQRAVALNRRLGEVDVLANSALAALDALRQPVLLLDRDCRVMHVNAAAGLLLREANGLSVTHGVLYAVAQAWTGRLHQVLARAAGQPPRAGALRLPRRADGRPLALLAMPFRREAHWSLPHRPAILVTVTDPDAIAAPPGRQLAELFGLTGAEAALASALLTGEELRAIAERSGRSLNTVRTLLKRLMAKTDVNRQSELIRQLALLPRFRDPV